MIASVRSTRLVLCPDCANIILPVLFQVKVSWLSSRIWSDTPPLLPPIHYFLSLNSIDVLSTLPVINTVFWTLIILGDIKGFGNFRLSIIFQVLSPRVNNSTESKYLDPPTLYCPLNPPATSRTYKLKIKLWTLQFVNTFWLSLLVKWLHPWRNLGVIISGRSFTNPLMLYSVTLVIEGP